VTTFGVTGHQELPTNAMQFVSSGMRELLVARDGPFIRGVSSLAAGADQLFAELVLELGGALEVIVPAADYESTFKDEAERETFQALLDRASKVVRLPFTHSSESAFWAAGRAVAERCEILVAVWDGRPSRGLGGTADVVGYARSRGTEVHVIWPPGMER
jgi:hypothetical protein